MKKIIASILMILMLSGCTAVQPSQVTQKPKNEATSSSKQADSVYVKSIWITYYELQKMIADNENDFKNNILDAFEGIKNMGFNTVTVQVRPCADSFYPSSYFPSSKYCFGKQGSDMKYDPLKVMCDVAGSKNINIEAWINPYRVSQDNEIDNLSNNNIAKKWYKNKATKSYVYVSKNGIYFNPSVDEVNELIVNGVKEIVGKYNISAIHFDDYFYPTTDKEIDEIQYNAYIKSKGKNNLATWRRSKVSNMVKSVYSAIKSINPNVRFGISPASNIDNDYSNLYADVKLWCSEKGYVDYICPQIYFGFKNELQPFMITTKKWCSMANCDLYVGLPLYKTNKSDKYASVNNSAAIDEFKNNSNIISRQINYLIKLNSVKGFYVFSYGYLFDENCKAEVENMLKAMQSSNLQ